MCPNLLIHVSNRRTPLFTNALYGQPIKCSCICMTLYIHYTCVHIVNCIAVYWSEQRMHLFGTMNSLIDLGLGLVPYTAKLRYIKLRYFELPVLSNSKWPG